jgi:hypothetical protein
MKMRDFSRITSLLDLAQHNRIALDIDVRYLTEELSKEKVYKNITLTGYVTKINFEGGFFVLGQHMTIYFETVRSLCNTVNEHYTPSAGVVINYTVPEKEFTLN